MPINIGFTGTRDGMTGEQVRALVTLLRGYREVIFHHGDCLGSDDQAHTIAKDEGVKEIVIHPPENPKLRAYRHGTLRKEKDFLDRNKDIVNECKFLIATPNTAVPRKRSGTWHTVRYAKKRGKSAWVIKPSGILYNYSALPDPRV